MNNRNLCFSIDNVFIYFANFEDMKLVYDMMHQDEEIREILFYGESEDIPFDEFLQRDRKWFPGAESRNSYYLIKYGHEIIGWISHTYNNAKIENMEVDIAFDSLKHTGKGIGTKIITKFTDYLNEKYNIKTFMIRPGKHNARAIKAYEKSGFRVIESYDPNNYYTAEDVVLWGDGDFGPENTVNMIKIYE